MDLHLLQACSHHCWQVQQSSCQQGENSQLGHSGMTLSNLAQPSTRRCQQCIRLRPRQHLLSCCVLSCGSAWSQQCLMQFWAGRFCLLERRRTTRDRFHRRCASSAAALPPSLHQPCTSLKQPSTCQSWRSIPYLLLSPPLSRAALLKAAASLRVSPCL